MAYKRVIPRDLFNEASLLKMLGALWIKLENVRGVGFDCMAYNGAAFDVEQDGASGAIYCPRISLSVGGDLWRLERPLNSREAWPLYATDPDGERDEIEVFDDLGELSPEFLGLIRKDF